MRFFYIGAFFLLSSATFFLTGVSSQTIVTTDLLMETNRFQKAPDLAMLSEAIKDVTRNDVNVSPATSVTKIVGNESGERSFYGYDVAIDGNTAVVGAYNEMVGPYRQGAAYVYVWNGSSWVHQQKLAAAPNSSGMDFGWSVAISGDTIMIGGPTYGCSASAVSCGAVYFFGRSGTTWTEQQRVIASDFEDSHLFGYDVAISGDSAIVGEVGNVIVEPGSAYFLQRSGGVWTEVQNVEHGGDTDDDFGWGVAIEGDTAVIGFPRYGNYTGGACVYDRTGSAWTRSSCLLPNDPSQGSQFGNTIDISGDSVLIGAPYSNTANGGAGYVFVREAGGGWRQEVKLTAPDAAPGDGLGAGVAIDGDRVVLGAWQHNSGTGAAYTFSRCLNDWGFGEKLVAADGAPADNFGRRLGLAGDKFITSSPFATVGGNIRQGAAYTAVIGSEVCEISIIVNRTTDESDDDIDDDVCDIDENTLEQECTLRAAIETANARAGRDLISFDISGGGVKTISPGTTLPLIVDPVTINAATQPGYANSPLIQLVGGSGANPALGLVAGSDNSRIKGLSITGFETGIAIHSWGNSIESCYLGVKADGTAPSSGLQTFGAVLVNGAGNNIIGGTEAIDGNVIGNLSVGIGFFGGAGSNRVLNNKIGTNAAGNTSMPNEVGVLINGANGNKIGEAGDGNLISGNLYGVEIYNASATFVRGNNIGTDVSGTSAIPNYIGVVIELAGNNKVGDVTTADGNLISGNEAYGVALFANTANNIIAGNNIGTKANGTEVLGNGAFGIIISEGANANTIDNNVIGGHTLALQAGGIVTTSDAGAANRIIDNHIGVVRDGTTGIPNNTGIKIFADGQIIGEQGHPNTICNSSEAGVFIASTASTDATGNLVQYNLIGTDGTQSIGEQTIGVAIAGASDNTVAFNVIANNEAGVAIIDGATENTVNGNKIGTAANGVTPFPNFLGVAVDASQDNAIKDNLVSGNDYGIFIGNSEEVAGKRNVSLRSALRRSPSGSSTYATGNKLSGNIVGLNADQTAPILSGVGIWVGQNARANIVGTADGGRNVIAGNSSYGLVIGTLVSNPPADVRPRDNIVQRNLIGISANGEAFSNSIGIVLSQTSGNTIGGVSEDLGNTIVASVSDGIGIADANGITIINNLIGILSSSVFSPGENQRASGAGTTYGNGRHGIYVNNAAGSTIGIAGGGNMIAGNQGDGIKVENSDSTQILANMIGVYQEQAITLANANSGNGINVANSNGTVIGGVDNNASNIIAANTKAALLIDQASQLVIVKNNLMGTVIRHLGNLNAEKNLGSAGQNFGNGLGGIKITNGSTLNTIGGTEANSGNIIANNGGDGIEISNSPGNIIGGAGVGNTIATNTGNGISVVGLSAVGNVLTGNLIGTAASAPVLERKRLRGSTLGNGGHGVYVQDAPNTHIGQAGTGGGNKIFDNSLEGIKVHSPTNTFPLGAEMFVSGNDVSFNLENGIMMTISHDVVHVLQDNTFEGNGKAGIDLADSDNNSVTQNVVTGNGEAGVVLSGPVTARNNVRGNIIAENVSHGVDITNGANTNNIGGPVSGQGNTIRNNGGSGIYLSPSAGSGNNLDPNSIYGNALRGIDIGGDGHTPNDPTDADTGPNNFQNYPEIMSTQVINSELFVTFRIDSAPEYSSYGMNGIYVEFFKADSNSEGERFLGSTHYTLDDYNSLVPGIKTVNLGDLATLGINGTDAITSTATDANGNTSEFTPRFGPTSAGVNVSGRVTTADGAGLRNAIVSITDMAGNVRTVRTGSFGYYKFEDVPAGGTYVIAVTSKRFIFTPQIITVNESVTDIDFIGNG